MIESSLSPASSGTNTIAGHFDYVDEDFAYGWACDPAKPFEPVRVDIVCDGRIVGQGLADGHRRDLEDAGIGEGNHAFSIKLSYELADGRVHPVIARNSSTGAILAGSKINYGPVQRILDFSIMPRETGLIYLDEILESSETRSLEGSVTRLKQAFQIGCLLQETGQINDARYVWESLAKVLGENSLLAMKIAEGYLLNSKPEQAIVFYKKSAEHNLLFTWAHLGMSACYRKLNDFDSAKESFDLANYTSMHHQAALEAIALEESHVLPILIEGLVSEGHTKQAVDILYSKLAKDFDHKYAQQKLALMLAEDLSYLGNNDTREVLISHRISLELLKLTLTCQNPDTY